MCVYENTQEMGEYQHDDDYHHHHHQQTKIYIIPIFSTLVTQVWIKIIEPPSEHIYFLNFLPTAIPLSCIWVSINRAPP